MTSRFLFSRMRNRIRPKHPPMSVEEIRVAYLVNQTRHPYENLTRTSQHDFFRTRKTEPMLPYASIISTMGLTANLGIRAGQ
jgi:hypothetical protein